MDIKDTKRIIVLVALVLVLSFAAYVLTTTTTTHVSAFNGPPNGCTPPNCSGAVSVLSNGNVGIGMTTPGQKLSVAGASMTFTSGGLGNPAVGIGNTQAATLAELVGFYAYDTSSGYQGWIGGIGVGGEAGSWGAKTLRFQVPDGGGNVLNALNILGASGNVGIGVTGPGYKLDVVSGGGTTARFGTAGADTVVIGGGAGKITVGTVDPVYTINGDKFATYGVEMTGVKGETTGVADFPGTSFSTDQTYSYTLDLAGAEKGSDLWLFKETTQILKNNLNGLVVILTPSFDGDVWYVKNVAKGTVTLFAKPSASAASLEVSYRLTAPRFDANQWSNIGSSDAPAGIIVNE